MTRRMLLFAVLGLLLTPLAASAQPNFSFRFAQTRQDTVEVSYVDPGGLAQQMGLKKGDVLRKITAEGKEREIRTNDDVHAALRILRGPYTIEVDRSSDGKSRPTRLDPPLKGEIRESAQTPGKFYHVADRP
jgi:S1-C subfamily serine protease